jgi:hypothetical protein
MTFDITTVSITIKTRHAACMLTLDAKCSYAECFIYSAELNVVMMTAVMLSVVAQFKPV